MPTRSVVLTDRQDDFVGQLVESGRYQSASEVLCHSLRLLQVELDRQQAELDDIRAGIIESLDQACRGELVEGEPEEIVGGAFTEVLKNHDL